MASPISKITSIAALCLASSSSMAGQQGLPKQCSASNVNSAVINEIKVSGGGVSNAAFIEIKTLQDNIDIAGWQICIDSPTNCVTLGQGNGGWDDGISTRLDNNSPFGNSVFPANYWISYSISANPSEEEVILLDSAGDVIDYVKYGRTARDCSRDLDFDVPSECGQCVTGRDSNQKDFARIPDGTGDWNNNGDAPTTNTSNDGSSPPFPNRIAEYFFDELTWDGTAGEVVDQSSNNLNLTMYNGAINEFIAPALVGDPGSCRYGNFSGTSYLEVSDSPLLDLQTYTISVWINPRSYPSDRLMSILSKDRNYEFHLDNNGQIFWWWGGGARDLTSSGAPIPLNTWTHIALAYRAGEQVMFVNGDPVASNNWADPLRTNNLPLQIGQDQGLSGRFFDGYIDEVKIFDRNLIAREVRQVMMDSRPCPATPAINGFRIEHDSHALTCQPEAIRISAVNSQGDVVTTYSGLINLSVSTNNGTWLESDGVTVNPDPAQGTLNDSGNNSGSATYNFAPSDNGSVILYLRNLFAESVNIDAGVGSLRDDDSEGLLTFRPIGFTVDTVSDAIAGRPFNATITAIGQDQNSNFCRVIEEYQGAQSLDIWTEHTLPNSAPSNLIVDGVTSGASAANAVSSQVTFTQGVANVSLRYDDVGSIGLALKDDIAVGDPTAGVITEVLGGTLPVRVRPFAYDIQIDGSPNATSVDDPVFAVAGDNFAMTVRSVLWQGADDLDNNGLPEATSNLNDNGVTPSISAIPGSLALNPSPQLVSNAGSLGAATVSLNTFGSVGSAQQGTLSLQQSWSEVGILQISAATNNFLGGPESINGLRANIGRFVPASFALTINNNYEAACGVFSYAGYDDGTSSKAAQTDDIELSVSALNRAGDVTQNYQSAFAKLEAGTLSASPINSINGLPASGSANIAATSSLSFVSGIAPNVVLDDVGYLFASISEPLSINLQLNATDSDNVNGNVATDSVEQRLGRAILQTSYGPEVESLELPLLTQYFQDARWQQNSEDSCTTYLNSELGFVPGSYQGDLNAGETMVMLPAVSETIINGRSSPALGFMLSAPGFGNSGEVDVIWNLTSQPWLQFDWNDDGLLDSPQSTAGFGSYRGSDRVINWQER